MIMIFNSSVSVFILHALFLSSVFTISNGVRSDINCLKSIKDSLQDPLNRLTWNFHNLRTESSVCIFKGVSCWNGAEARIFSIELGNMGLKGKFPQGMDNCNSIQDLNFTGNNLSGPIPTDLCEKQPYLVTLDLSNNKFSGEIPPAIANCKFLNSLVLDNNNLTGHIPWQITMLQRLRIFSVSNNLLSGPVPNFASRIFPQESYANNSGLCGVPLGPCRAPLGPCHTWSKFKQGFVVGYVAFIVSTVTIFFSYCMPWIQVNNGKKQITVTKMIMLLMRKNKKRGGG